MPPLRFSSLRIDCASRGVFCDWISVLNSNAIKAQVNQYKVFFFTKKQPATAGDEDLQMNP